MDFSGNILKMKSEMLATVNRPNIFYKLPVGGDIIDVNSLVGSSIRIDYNGEINCIYCGRLTGKSFAQGYCYPCFVSLPQTDQCILHPEKCKAHMGISRDMSWSENNCLTDHYVYLALTPGLKVGVTRASQIPTRWIDQGASEAIILARTPNRHMAGTIEVFLKDHLADKTNWRRMLSGERNDEIDLHQRKEAIINLLPEHLAEFVYMDNKITQLHFPVNKFPLKAKPLNMDKTPLVVGILSGIKGQYLIFESGEVLNIRKHAGYNVEIRY